MNTHVRDNLNSLQPSSNTVATSETTTSTTYVALTTASAVTVTTGTTALVSIHCKTFNSGANYCRMSFAVSTTSTIAAADARSAMFLCTGANVPQSSISRTFKLTGLTAGSNVFSTQFMVSAGTGTFLDRDITVTALST